MKEIQVDCPGSANGILIRSSFFANILKLQSWRRRGNARKPGGKRNGRRFLPLATACGMAFYEPIHHQWHICMVAGE